MLNKLTNNAIKEKGPCRGMNGSPLKHDVKLLYVIFSLSHLIHDPVFLLS